MTLPRQGWAAELRHVQALALCRQAGMSRTGIMHHLGIEESSLTAAIRAGRALGLDVASTAPRGGTGGDDAALFAGIAAEVAALLEPEEGRDSAAPAAAGPDAALPVDPVEASLRARGLSPEAARAAARQHHSRAADREARARQAARATAQQVQRRRVSGQGYRMGLHDPGVRR